MSHKLRKAWGIIVRDTVAYSVHVTCTAQYGWMDRLVFHIHDLEAPISALSVPFLVIGYYD